MFAQLVAQLALHIQGIAGAASPAWPAQGLPAATLQFLQNLLAQIQISIQGQGQPLQLLAAQPGSVALMQALVQAAAQAQGSAASASSAIQTATARSPTAAAALEQVGRAVALPPSSTRVPLLQNWWVQQGSLQTAQGERHFSLTLQVPVTWAQAVGGAAPTQGQGAMWRLPVADLAALPSSGPLALVLQPQGLAGAEVSKWATSALLWLEIQPASATTSATPGTAAMTSPLAAAALAQEMPPLLQNKADPWLLMAAAQAANALPVSARQGEHRTHLCRTETCQYQGLAPCAQPFCSEMNRIWASTSR